MKHLFYFICLFFVLPTLRAQAPAGETRRPGELLIRLQGDADVPGVTAWLERETGVDFDLKRTVAASWRIYLLRFDESSEAAATRVLTIARRCPGIDAAQWNHVAPERNVEPDDPQWPLQDDMRQITADEAWVASTGGLTPAGDTIVVAILEKGVKRDHPDLVENLWVNYAEIPDNEVDDDGNGYVDDHRGWDARNDGDGPGAASNNHGTGVTGIVGARGNNDRGVTGVNWQVKLLTITNVEYEDEIIAAHEYVAKMRQRYNASNRAEGAFIVALNASFGINNAMAVDHPLWCGVYDQLGAAGVLSAGATTNANTNVDLNGDMPTSCPSEYLIAVNNVTPLDVKAPATGFGSTSIDLGAPGNDTYTTSSNQTGYGNLDGTSAATPHVAGAIALLYSISCDVFTSDALTAPAQCALRVRDMIFANVKPLPSLANITKTGGRLDLAPAAAEIRELCDGTAGPLDIKNVGPAFERGQLEIVYETPDFRPYTFRVFNMLGQLIIESSVTPPQFGVKSLTVDLDFLPAGMYVFSIGRGKSVATEKFIKI